MLLDNQGFPILCVKILAAIFVILNSQSFPQHAGISDYIFSDDFHLFSSILYLALVKYVSTV